MKFPKVFLVGGVIVLIACVLTFLPLLVVGGCMMGFAIVAEL